MRKGKLFSGKTWKRIVRILSCIVVFCTTYALILPAITQEAQAYCGSSEHKHTKQCYKEIESCGKEEHQHGEGCYDADGNLTCTLEEHTHSDECFRELLECTEEEHTHSLECFSDPEADKETEEDWKKTLPDEEALKDKSDTEKVLMIAESQKGYKESEKNYVVENETEKKGVTRYGQWDKDPYEDWAGAYARFVLHYAGIETADAKKHTSDWLEQLHDKGELKAADEAEAGDVLFVYDEKDQLKAGIVSEVKDGTVKAWMGDWDNQVQEKTFSKTDEKVHSVWKAIQKEEPADPVQPEGPAEPEIPAEEEQKPEETPKADEEKPAEQPKDEEPVVSYDFTQEVEAEDGAKIKVSWNAGTFETGDVVFQAKKVELTEEEQKKVQEQLDKDKNYSYLTYDLTFYETNNGEDLIEVEPKGSVKIELSLPEETKCNKEFDLFHTDDFGKVEQLVERGSLEQEKNAEGSDVYSAKFVADSFSLFTVVIKGDGTKYLSGTNTDFAWGKISGDIFNGTINELQGDLNINSTIEFTAQNNQYNAVVIDLKGHKINVSTGTAFKVNSGFTLIIKNTGMNNNTIQYSNSSSTWDTIQTSNIPNTVAVIERNADSGDLIEVTSGGRLSLENVALLRGNTQIKSTEGTVQLKNSYLLQGNRGLCALSNSNVEIDGGAVSDHPNNGSFVAQPGGGIYAQNSTVTLNGGAVVANNTVKTINNGVNSGGGIHLNNSELHVRNASVNGNRVWASGDGDGSWATGGGIKATNGSMICLFDGSSVKGNFTDNSGGGISLSGNDTRLYMYGGEIDNNYAKKNEGGGLALQATDGQSTAVLYKGIISNNKTDTGNGSTAQWGGGGIFVGEGTRLVLPEGADITGNTASSLGGGLAGCATGKVYIDENVVVQGNTAEGNGNYSAGTKPEDRERASSGPYALTKYQAMDYFTCYQANIPSQFKTADGTLIGASMTGKIDGVTVNEVSEGRLNTQLCLGLTAGNKSIAQDKPVKITGNSSYIHGGGVLVNGYLVGGSVEKVYKNDVVKLKGNKSLKNKAGQSFNANGFRFRLKNGNQVIGIAESDSNGVFEFSNIDFGEIGDINTQIDVPLTYTLEEFEAESDPKPGVLYDSLTYQISFTVRVSKPTWFTYTLRDEDTGQINEVKVYEFDTSVQTGTLTITNSKGEQIHKDFTTQSISSDHTNISYKNVHSLDLSTTPAGTFNNQLVETTNLKVVKTWEGDPEGISHDSDTVKVQLFRYLGSDAQNKQPVGDPVEISKNTNWQYGWTNLPTESGSEKYTYLVEEFEGPQGYISIITSGADLPDITHSVNVWKPVEDFASISSSKEYLLINVSENKTLSSNLNYGKIDSNDILTIPDAAVINKDQIKYYRQSEFTGAQVLKLDANAGRDGYIFNAGNNSSYHLLGEYSQYVLQWSQDFGQNNDLNGFYYENDFLKMYGYNDASDRYIGWNNGQFILTNSGNNNIQLYEKGTVEIMEPDDTDAVFTITNKRIANSLVITKKDSQNGEILKGAQFELYKQNELVATEETGDDGKIVFSDLGEGTYVLKEVKAPEGYVLPIPVPQWEIKFDNSGENNPNITIEREITNEPFTYELPETGSAGTKIYTATGTILLLTGTSLYRYKRRRRRKGGEAH